MVDRIDKLINSLSDFDRKLPQRVLDCVRENESVIVDMNAEEQLYEHGQNRLGVDISDYQPYTRRTIELKKIKGQPYDRVTLRDTGEFEASFFICYDSDSWQIQAADEKTDKLVKKYGAEILGLNDENMNEIIWEYLRPYLLGLLRHIANGENL